MIEKNKGTKIIEILDRMMTKIDVMNEIILSPQKIKNEKERIDRNNK